MEWFFLQTTALALTFPWFPLPYQRVLGIVFGLMLLVTPYRHTMKLLTSSLSSIRRIPTFLPLRRKFSCSINNCCMPLQIGSRHWCKIGNGFPTLVVPTLHFTRDPLLSQKVMLLLVIFLIWNVRLASLLRLSHNLHQIWRLVLCRNLTRSTLIILLLAFVVPLTTISLLLPVASCICRCEGIATQDRVSP